VARVVEYRRANGGIVQRHVEIAIGRLMTDEDARRALRESPAAFFAMLRGAGLELSAVEEEALVAIDHHACAQFAESLDPRIQKLSLRPKANEGEI
jgi:hypothetical protein